MVWLKNYKRATHAATQHEAVTKSQWKPLHHDLTLAALTVMFAYTNTPDNALRNNQAVIQRISYVSRYDYDLEKLYVPSWNLNFGGIVTTTGESTG